MNFKDPELHPLFDESITWLSISDMERIRSLDINRAQHEREARAQREHDKKPSWMLEDSK
jgi:hypothetical protein